MKTTEEPYSATRADGPLAGLRVLDLTQMLSGPICCMRLADFGAEVIKIEPPGDGEWTRTHGFANAEIGGITTAFLGINRNKKSVVLDLKSPAGLAAFKALVVQSDIVVENFRRGTAERLGIGYEQLRSINPRIVYGSISGYGEDGPMRDQPGQDLLLQAMSGSMFSVGSKEMPPMPGPLWAVDVMAGYQLGFALLAALREREHSGQGQKVHVSMLAVVMDCQCQELVTALNLGIKPQRGAKPFAHAWVTAPYGAYRTLDGWMVVSQVALSTLGEALEDDNLKAMTKWSDGMDRRDAVHEIVCEKLRHRTTAEWLEVFSRHRLWGGKVYDYTDLANDPHVQATGMVVSIEHPVAGTLRMPDIPAKFSRTPGTIRTPPPLHGQHTTEVLENVAGLSSTQAAALWPGRNEAVPSP